MSEASSLEERTASWIDRWKSAGYFVDRWVSEPGESWTDEGHPGDEHILLLRGRLEVELPNGTVSPLPGEAVHIPRGTPHTVRNPGAEQAEIEWAHQYAYEVGKR